MKDSIAVRDPVLVKLEAARQYLSEATDLAEVKNVADVAASAEVYARRQQLGEESIAFAHRVKIDALARLGELLDLVPKNAGSRGVGTSGVPQENPTLADYGISKKVSAVAQQLAKLPPEVREEIASGEKSLTQARREVQEQANAEMPTPEPPKGKYDVIVIDPPWQMEKIARDVRPNQVSFDYPTMVEAELVNFPVTKIAGDDCHLFCWTTHKHLPLALRLVVEWGFRYVCTMVWHKPGGFQPIGLPQYNCEFILYARRGSPSFIDTKAFPVCFNAPRREHSRKPDEFYDVIRRVTSGLRIDVFSREAREGFDQFGNDTEAFVS